MHRFKAAALNIASARDAQEVEAAVSRFLDSLSRSERVSIEAALGYALPHSAGRISAVSHDLTRAELRGGGDKDSIALVAETAQVFIIASNRLTKLIDR